jgi:hypothetical protein
MKAEKNTHQLADPSSAYSTAYSIEEEFIQLTLTG